MTEPIASALDHFERLALAARGGWQPLHPDDITYAAGVYQDVMTWLFADQENAAAFVAVTQAYIAANAQLISLRVGPDDDGNEAHASVYVDDSMAMVRKKLERQW